MTKRDYTTEEHIERIRNSYLWAGSPFTAAQVAHSLGIDDVRAAQILNYMSKEGLARRHERVGKSFPSVRYSPPSNHWLKHDWGRKHTNRELGLKARFLGVPV